MFNIEIHNKFIKKFKSGYPAVFRQACRKIPSGIEEGDMFTLTDSGGNSFAKAYYGIQNKCVGFLLPDSAPEELSRNFFSDLFDRAFTARKKFRNNPDTNLYRLFNAEGDGFGGMTIDYYAGYLLVNFYNRGIIKYADDIFDVLKNRPGVKGIYAKKRFSKGGKYIDDNDFVLGQKAPEPLLVKENGITIATRLNDGASTGIFADQRDIRKLLREKFAAGKSVLNTFSYTGAFSVAAALGGASKTVSVDLAGRSLKKTREMFEVNNISLDNHEIRVADIFEYYKFARKKNLTFDMVILDPPSFASSQKHTFSAKKDYPGLIAETLDVCPPGGIIIASTNCGLFDFAKFLSLIDKGAKMRNRKYKVLSKHSLPEDFKVSDRYPEGNYLKVAFLQV